MCKLLTFNSKIPVHFILFLGVLKYKKKRIFIKDFDKKCSNCCFVSHVVLCCFVEVHWKQCQIPLLCTEPDPGVILRLQNDSIQVCLRHELVATQRHIEITMNVYNNVRLNVNYDIHIMIPIFFSLCVCFNFVILVSVV